MSELVEVYTPEPFDPEGGKGDWAPVREKTPEEVQRAVQRHLLALGELVEQAGADLVLTDEFLYRLFRGKGRPVLQVWHDGQTATLRLRVHGARTVVVPGEVTEG